MTSGARVAKLPRSALPLVVLSVDPDASRTAISTAVLADVRGLEYRWEKVDCGRGAKTAKVPWSSISGFLPLLRHTAREYSVSLAKVHVVVEAQAPDGPRSSDVEALRKVRYHIDAACELAGSRCVHVGAPAWQGHFVPSAAKRGAGSIKRAYMMRAREITGRGELNEDECASVGVLDWYVVRKLGCTVRYK